MVFGLKVNFGVIILGKTTNLSRSKSTVEASKLKGVDPVVLAYTKLKRVFCFCFSLTLQQLNSYSEKETIEEYFEFVCLCPAKEIFDIPPNENSNNYLMCFFVEQQGKRSALVMKPLA